jgi:hypothetical protein
MLGLVDWQVLLLFIGLFIVNHALEQTGPPEQAVADLAASGIDLRQPVVLFGTTFLLSNQVPNVPAVMLLLPIASSRDGALLAPFEHPGGQSAGGLQHREHHRHGRRRPTRHRHRLGAACPRGRTGDCAQPSRFRRGVVGMADRGRLTTDQGVCGTAARACLSGSNQGPPFSVPAEGRRRARSHMPPLFARVGRKHPVHHLAAHTPFD